MRLPIIKTIRVLAGLLVLGAGVKFVLDGQLARGGIGILVGAFWLATSFTDFWWKIGQPKPTAAATEPEAE